MTNKLREGYVIKGERLWLSLCAWTIVFAYLFCIPIAATNGGDFVHLWVGAHTIATGNGEYLYNPEFHKEILIQYHYSLEDYWGPRYEILGAFFYPPITGLIYSPLGLLEPTLAQGVQASINLGVGLLSAWLLTEIIDHRLSYPAVLILLFSFPPFFYCYVLGQNGIQTMGIVLAGWYALKRNRSLWAGGWWSLLLFKPNWLLAVSWIPLLERRYKMILGILLGVTALTSFASLALGLSSFTSYFTVFIKLLGLHNLPQYPLESQYSLLSLIRRYVGMTQSADLLGWAIVVMILGISMGLIWRSHSAPTQIKQQCGKVVLALALVTAVCINPHLHHYDLLLIGVASIVALSERALLSNREKQVVTAIFAFQYVAFLMEGLFVTSYAFPIIATLILLCWLMLRVWAPGGSDGMTK